MYELDPPEASARKAVAGQPRVLAPTCATCCAERRAHPGDDLISELAAVVDEGDPLTEDELIATCVLLLNAGHEASVNGAGNGWWTLFRHPDAAGAAPRGPGLAADRDRGAPALRHAAAAVRALGPRADRGRRASTIPRGDGGRAPVRLGEPRPGRLRPGR